MRYLKYINESFDKSDYYSEVERYEFLDKVGDSNSDSKERSILYKRLCNDFSSDRCEIEDNQILYGRFGLSKLCIGMDFEVSGGIFEFGIYLLSDEWYMVSVAEIIYPDILECKFYKCDQIDGLMELIRDKEEDIYSKYSSVEKLDESFNKSDYYIKMGDDFAFNDIEKKIQDLDERDEIKSLLSDNVFVVSEYYETPHTPFENGKIIKNLTLQREFQIPRGREYWSYNIFKSFDEFYYVRVIVQIRPIGRLSQVGQKSINIVSDGWYRCDQFEGLMVFLKDKKVI